jgi:CHAD domain-containing protein
LGTDADGSSESPLLRVLRAWLQKQRQVAETNLQSSMASEALRALFELKPAIARLAIYPDGFRPIALGLRNSYRDARKAFDSAFASGSDEDFHEWRKTLQHHWRHMQLLAPCWPAELSARVELARNLSQILGDDHDIALLRHLASAPTMSFASHEDVAAFLKRCRKCQKDLRRAARIRGSRLLVERSRPFVERIEAHWLAAAQGAKGASVKSRVDNVIAFSEAGAARERASA